MGFWSRRQAVLVRLAHEQRRLTAYFERLAACERHLGLTPMAPGAANSYRHVMSTMLGRRDEGPLDWQDGLSVHFDVAGRPVETRFGFSIRTTGMDESRFITDGFISREISETLLMIRAAEWADCFLDVGANVGYFSLLMAACGDSGLTCYAFEPVKAVFDRVVASVADNGFGDRVHVQHAAMGAAVGEAEVRLHRQGSGGSSLCTRFPNPDDDSGIRETIRTTTLDTFLDEHQLAPQRGVVKIDVEGLEGRVLDGAEGYLTADRPPVVLIETFRRSLFGESHDAEVLGRLRGWGYHVYGVGRYAPHRAVLTPAFAFGRLRRSPEGNYMAFAGGQADLETECREPADPAMLIGIRRMAQITAFHQRTIAAASKYARRLSARLSLDDPERPPDWEAFVDADGATSD